VVRLESTLQDAADVQAAIARAPRALRTISIEDPDSRIAFATASHAVPGLERLDLDVASVDFTGVAAPTLQRLELVLSRPTVDDVATLLDWLSRHAAITRVGVRTDTTGSDLVDAWKADSARRPPTLTGFAWSTRGLVARRT
jgi:hypothetical protein